MLSETTMPRIHTPQAPLFVPHGAPTFALAPGAAGAALARSVAMRPRPRAVVIASAHWHTARPAVGSATRPHTIHDFRGFPAPLYGLRYPATGCPEAANEVHQALCQAGFAASLDRQRGLDHGAWIPLRMLFPDADIPVIPLSIQAQATPTHHLQIGRALAPLARQGFLVIGSGNLTHNLHDFVRARTVGLSDPDYVREFSDWVWQRLCAGDQQALLDYRRRAPAALRAHPDDDHLLPLFVALGAAGSSPSSTRLHSGIDDVVIAMDAFAFHPQEDQA